MPTSVDSVPGREALDSDACPLILIVDDNEQNRALAQTTLEEEGYRTKVAAGGAEALQAFDEAPP